MAKVRRRELITIRVTASERVDIQRLAYMRQVSVSALVRAFVARELEALDPGILRKLHGRRAAKS